MTRNPKLAKVLAKEIPVYEAGSTHRTLRGDVEFTIEKLGAIDKEGRQLYMVKDPTKARLRCMTGAELLTEIRPPKREGFVYFSASQVATAMRCMRKWAFEKIDGIKVPSTRDQTFGTDTHSVLEGYLEGNGWSDDEGQQDAVGTAKQGVAHLPMFGEMDYTVEHYFEFEFLDGKAIFVGFIDLWIPLNEKGIPQVTDHKTTKDLRYAMSKNKLKVDVQSNTYGKFALDESPDADEVMLKWLYYCARPNGETDSGRPRKPRGFRAVPVIRTRAEIEEQWAIIAAKCQEMYDLKVAGTPAKECEANSEACWDYGGCPYKNRCEVKKAFMEPAQLVHSKKEKGDTKMKNLMDIIKNKKANKAKEAPTDDINPPKVETKEEVPKPAAKKKAAPKKKRRTKKEIEAEKAAKAEAEAAASDVHNGASDWERGEDSASEADDEPPAKTPRAKAKATARKAKPNGKNGKSNGAMSGLVLFVDTVPVKGSLEAVSLAEWTADFKAGICEAYEVGFWNGLKFYQGEQHLGQCVTAHLAENKVSQVLLCDSRSAEWKACGGVLLEHADMMVKGC